MLFSLFFRKLNGENYQVMKTNVAVYRSHDEAMKVMVSMKENGFPMDKVSLLGTIELIDDNIHVRSNRRLIRMPILYGTILGTIIGLMTGVGLFSIPGFEPLFNAGAVIGALAGFEVGVAAGGLGTIILQLAMNKDFSITYNEHVRQGNYLLLIEGSDEEIEWAKNIIDDEHNHYSVNEIKHAV